MQMPANKSPEHSAGGVRKAAAKAKAAAKVKAVDIPKAEARPELTFNR